MIEVRRIGGLGPAVLAWGAALAAGFGLLLEYGAVAGPASRAPESWPEASALVRDPNRPTLVFVAHPRCSCTRASLAELARLTTRLSDRVAVRTLVVQPAGVSPEFTRTDLRDRAALLAGVDPHIDQGGVEATRFGAETSGTTLLYGTDGRLRFQGGITSRRGHEGASVGHRRILELVLDGTTDRDRSEVFGCRIRGREPGDAPRSRLEAMEFPGPRGEAGRTQPWCG